MADLEWKKVDNKGEDTFRWIGSTYRAKVPGGWLVRIWRADEGVGLTFVPDPNHEWN
jgi:hypothetical protein